MKQPQTPHAEQAEQPAPSRRQFITGTAQAAGALAFVGPFAARAAATPPPTPVWGLVAETVPQNFADGSTVQLTRYHPEPGGPLAGDRPLLEGIEGAPARLRITNNSQIPLHPHIAGVGTAPTIYPGQTGGMRFVMPPAGTHLLFSTPQDQISNELGLGALIISRPANGLQEVWAGGPTFDREYVMLYQDIDSRWNDKVAMRQRPDFADYEPNFFLVNGLSYPDTASDLDTTIACNVGERVLLRFGNLGRMRQAIHFHGYHVEIVDRDNQPELYLPMKDTFGLPHAGTVNAILTPHQAGIYPLHPHSLTSVTANGVYPYGQLALIIAS